MHPVLRHFIRQYLGVVVASVLPVVLTAFLSMPAYLTDNPAQIQSAAARGDRHLT